MKHQFKYLTDAELDKLFKETTRIKNSELLISISEEMLYRILFKNFNSTLK